MKLSFYSGEEQFEDYGKIEIGTNLEIQLYMQPVFVTEIQEKVDGRFITKNILYDKIVIKKINQVYNNSDFYGFIGIIENAITYSNFRLSEWLVDCKIPIFIQTLGDTNYITEKIGKYIAGYGNIRGEFSFSSGNYKRTVIGKVLKINHLNAYIDSEKKKHLQNYTIISVDISRNLKPKKPLFFYELKTA